MNGVLHAMADTFLEVRSKGAKRREAELLRYRKHLKVFAECRSKPGSGGGAIVEDILKNEAKNG